MCDTYACIHDWTALLPLGALLALALAPAATATGLQADPRLLCHPHRLVECGVDADGHRVLGAQVLSGELLCSYGSRRSATATPTSATTTTMPHHHHHQCHTTTTTTSATPPVPHHQCQSTPHHHTPRHTTAHGHGDQMWHTSTTRTTGTQTVSEPTHAHCDPPLPPRCHVRVCVRRGGACVR